MPENEPPFDPAEDITSGDGSITPPSADLQLEPNQPGAPATGWQPELGIPERSFSQKPRWPHPSFGWSLLWCPLFWIVTQLPGAFLCVLIIAGLAVLSPNALPLEILRKPAELYKTEAMNIGLAAGQFVTEILVIGFSWLIIRLIVGRDWMRQLAVRLPSLAHTLLALAIFPPLILLGNVAYQLIRASRRVPSVSDANPLNLVYFWVAVFVVVGFALLAAWLLAGLGWTRRLAARPVRSTDILIAAAVVPALLLCIIVIYEWLRWAFQVPALETIQLSGMEEMVEIFGKWPWGLAVLVIGLGPGIGEELWCRGFLGRGLIGNHGVVLGVLASSFCFGLIHGDPCQGMMAMVMGLWLHFVYLITRSLLLPMLLHFLNNSVAVLAPRFPQLTFLDAKPAEIPLTVYVSAAFLLAAGVYALCQSRPKLAPTNPEQALIWRPAFEGVEYPPDGSSMKVVHPLPSLASTALVGGSFLLFLLACASWAIWD